MNTNQSEEKSDSFEDPEYDHFERWYESEQGRFHCGQMNERDIAYSAFLEGMRFKAIE
jgi:hypothetical protein